MQGKYADAESNLQQALGIREQKFGTENPKVASTLESYAALLRELGRNSEAEVMEIRIEAINNKVSDLDSVNPIQ
jgi:hypothetical protein